MNRLLRFVSLAAILSGLGATQLAAQDSTVYLVHGIPGQDINQPPELPVDVTFNGTCLFANVPFGVIEGPLPCTPGPYLVEVRPADLLNPGSQPPLIVNNFQLEADISYAIVAHLTDTGELALSSFVEDLSPVTPERSRATIHHVAYATPADVEMHHKLGPEVVTMQGITNGDQVGGELLAGVWRMWLYSAGASEPRFGPYGLNLQQRTAYMIFGVGSFVNHTFTVLVKPVRVGRD